MILNLNADFNNKTASGLKLHQNGGNQKQGRKNIVLLTTWNNLLVN